MSGLLAIDTASDSIAVAYEDPDGNVTVATYERPREHSSALLSLVDHLVGSRLGELEAIVVVRGPGGYAGIRVGIATAQGLSIATGVRVAGVDTLRAIAESVWDAEGREDVLVAVHPAGRGDFAAQRFEGGASAGPMELTRLPLEGRGLVAGEGAGEHGGREIDAAARVQGALGAYRRGAVSPAEALYVREPHITLARKTVIPAGPGNARGG